MRTRLMDWMTFRGEVASLRRLAAGVLLNLLSATLLYAQEAEEGGGTIIPAGRSWIIEAVITGALVALALYAVCRASRRQ